MAQLPRSGNEIKIAGNPELYYREQNARIVALQDGGFIAVWHRIGNGGGSIQAQIYAADGSKIWDPITVTSATDKDVGNPDIAVLTDGRIVVAWESTNIPASEYESRDKNISAQILRPDGSKLNGSFSATGILGAGMDSIPKVTALANGEFMIAWNDHAENFTDSSHVAYRYTKNGSLKAFAAIEMEHKTPQGDVTGLKNGGYAQVATVLQTDAYYSDGSGTSIAMEFYKEGSADNYIWASGRINTSVEGDQHQASAVTLSNGNVVFVWTDENTAADGSGSCIKARIFTGVGKPLTGEILVNTTTIGYQSWPVIEALTDGGFAVAFLSRELRDHDVRVATFDAGGARRGDDFIATGSTAGNQTNPSLAALKDGRFVVSWTDQDLSTRAQIFGTAGPTPNPNPNPNPNPVPVPTTLVGTTGDDLLDGTKVMGLIDGLGGKDTVTYEAAQSGIVVLLGSPEFNAGHAAGDTFKDIEIFIGSSHGDQLIGDGQSQELRGVDGDDLLMGNGGADTLIGGEGNDTLVGGEGADRMEGGAGINVASYHEASGRVTASLQNSSMNAGEAAGDTYTAIQNLTGSNFGDILQGDGGSNTLTGGEGNDSLVGGEGADHLIGGNGDDTLDGGGGLDILDGGAGRNVYVNADQDQIVGGSSGALDILEITRSLTLAEGSALEGLKAGMGAGAISLTGNSIANIIIGNKAMNTLQGRGGNDDLSGAGGNDKLKGDLGNDQLSGGMGQDILIGGAGRDTFLFDDRETSSSESKADYITDFSGRQGDKIELSAIDANTKKRGDQKFSFIGEETSFSKAGEVRFEKTKSYTYVYLNTDSDMAGEAVIKLKGAIELSKSWFAL